MDAPERIYIHPTLDNLYGMSERSCDNEIEYIRKDSFIEKAAEWLRTHSEADYFELITVANYCGAGNLNKKKMIEDFEEYLKK